MNRFEQDEKDAGVHQIHLIDVRQDPGSPRNAENEISWCSFYVFSKIFGLLCLMTGLTCMVLLSSDSTHSHNIKGGLISKGIFNLVLMSKKMCNSVNSGQEIQRLDILNCWGTVLIQTSFSSWVQIENTLRDYTNFIFDLDTVSETMTTLSTTTTPVIFANNLTTSSKVRHTT